MSSSEQPPIILYHYDTSPYAKRIVWYLQLRGIPYQQCIQPPIQPRPDIASLGIKYRRIPLLSIGRDVYLDTRLILQRLESLPTLASLPKLGATEGTEHRAVERLLSTLINEAGAFAWAVAMFPPTLPIFKDERFLKDRSEFMGATGRKFGPSAPQTRAEAAANLRGVFSLLENTFLADGRDWILGGRNEGVGGQQGPSLADLEGVWVLHWLRSIPGALPKEVLSEQQFPRVFAWIKRFDRAVKAAAHKFGSVPKVSGKEAVRTIVGAAYVDGAEDGNDSFGQIAKEEPVAQALGLNKGDRVVVYPLDTGSTYKDEGRLLHLDGDEVVFETRATVEGTPAIRVHAPRSGFRVVPEKQTSRL